jgi:hypothetical protein
MIDKLRRYIVLKVASRVYRSESVMSLIREWQQWNEHMDHVEWELRREQDLRSAAIFEALGGKNPDDWVPWE